MRGRCKPQQGLSLLEVMLLTFVLSGALVAGYLVLKTRTASDAAQSQANVLAQADRALVGFAAAHNRLSCPDTDRDGVEDCAGVVQKGWLPYRTLGLEGAGAKAGVGELRYLVQRQAVDLTTAADVWQPVMFKNNTEKYTATRSFTPSNIGTPDLCGKLSTGGSTALAANHAQVASVTPRRVAYALAHPGSRDEDGDGNLFDDVNATGLNSLNAAERSNQTSVYDDRVTERTYGSLALALDCDRLLASLNGLSLATEFVEEVNDMKSTNILVASVLTGVSAVKAGIAGYKIFKASVQLGTSMTYMGTASGLLSAAIASCAILVGCFEIPHAAASVVAAGVSIGASAAAIVASAASMASSLVAAGLTLVAAIEAGSTSTTPTMDISAAVESARVSMVDMTAKKDAAYTAWQKAISDETALYNEKNNKITAAYGAAQSIMTATKNSADATAANLAYAANHPTPPAELPANTSYTYTASYGNVNALDGYVTAAVDAATAWRSADKAYENAKAVYEDAVKTTSGGPGSTPPFDNSALLAEMDAQIAAETDPAKKQTLIDTRARLVAGTTGPTSNVEQVNQITSQLAGLNSQITDLNNQIAADPANADLKARRDSLLYQRDQLQAQLSTLSMDVASALAYKNSMFAAREAAYTAYRAAYVNAANAAGSVPYTIQKCTKVTSGSTTTTTCDTPANYTFGDRSSMENALHEIFDNRVNYWFFVDFVVYQADQGVFFQWSWAQYRTTAAKVAYDEAVSKEARAISAYNALKDMSTRVTGSGTLSTVWNGAEAILQQADKKGGIR